MQVQAAVIQVSFVFNGPHGQLKRGRYILSTPRCISNNFIKVTLKLIQDTNCVSIPPHVFWSK